MSRTYWKVGATVMLAAMLGPAWGHTKPPATTAKRIPDSYAHAGRLIDIGHGRHLNLRCTGSGPRTVLLEAGSHADSSTWFRLQPLLASFTRVCAYDRAGYGFSSEGPMPRNLDADVSDLHALIRRAGIRTPLVLVGHSLGSNIVRDYASRYPAEVGAMVLVDPPAQDIGRFDPGWQKVEDTLSVQRFAYLRQCEAAAEKHQLPSTSPGLRQCLDGPDPLASAKLNAVNLAHESTPVFWHTVLSELHDNAVVFRQPVSPRENHGSIPLIVLSAANTYADALPRDRKGLEAARAHTQAQIVATSSGGQLVQVADSSHDIQIDQPAAVARAVNRALRLSQRTPG